MKRTHLPLNALRVFDAAARHLSFTRAADELAVTPAAVGQQIRALEETLGVILFRRQTRGLELTPEAARGLPFLREGFRQFEDSVRTMQQGQASNMLTIAAPRALIAKWLAVRLANYAHKQPQLRFALSSIDGMSDGASDNAPDFSQANLDLAIHFGEAPDAEGVHAKPLGVESLLLVGLPGMATDAPRIAHPLDDGAGGSIMSDAALALDAAMAGLGVALVPSLLAASHLQAGELVALSEPVPSRLSWWLSAPTPQWRQAKVRSLVDYLIGVDG